MTSSARQDDRPAGIGAAGLAVSVVGAVMCLLSFMVLPWYGGSHAADSAGSVKFKDLHLLTKAFAETPAITKAYFAWLSWSVLIIVIILAIAANLPSPASTPMRGLGLALGLFGAGATYYALSALHDAQNRHGGTGGGVFDNAQLGVWLALGGFVLAGLGAAVGPASAR